MEGRVIRNLLAAFRKLMFDIDCVEILKNGGHRLLIQGNRIDCITDNGTLRILQCSDHVMRFRKGRRDRL